MSNVCMESMEYFAQLRLAKPSETVSRLVACLSTQWLILTCQCISYISRSASLNILTKIRSETEE